MRKATAITLIVLFFLLAVTTIAQFNQEEPATPYPGPVSGTPYPSVVSPSPT